MKSWKTTLSGIVAIFAALVWIVASVAGIEVPAVTTWAGAVSAISAGVGLLKARDDRQSETSP
jgi:hypothetical protein